MPSQLLQLFQGIYKARNKHPSESDMYISKVQNKLVQPPPPPPPITLEKKTKEKSCDLFHACLYFEEDILKQNCFKEAGFFFFSL